MRAGSGSYRIHAQSGHGRRLRPIRHDRRRETHRRGAAGVRGTPDPRLRELLAALIRHLHAFAAETGLTHREWLAGLEFLTAVGQTCDDQRQEFVLLSDVLGLSAQVDHVNAAAGATEPTVLGPFYRPGAPQRAPGEHIGRPEDGAPTLIRGRVTATTGQPIEGATLDVWQCSANGLYDTQDPQQPPFNLRGVFTTGAGGGYEFRAVRPVSYPIPVDGPVGDLLRAAGRPNWRASHVHAIVSARRLRAGDDAHLRRRERVPAQRRRLRRAGLAGPRVPARPGRATRTTSASWWTRTSCCAGPARADRAAGRPVCMAACSPARIR